MVTARQDGKSAAAFRTISEVSEELNVPQHVLRFWETKFTQVRPMKRGGGRRYYRPEDIELLRGIRDLLYQEGFTIRGVQKLLREGGVAALENGAPSGATVAGQVASGGLKPEKDQALRDILGELQDLSRLLKEN
ncbi:MerR family transcriptional regulator [Fodinicurvata fenggangensis]|uniref:MerR family transcriptional regulator n=1 Tax=Fodinicurvata fenggangensis TaxID=1121830 RepID=UPI00047B1B24|nr:MerR family transcriptional regulator [Fodinicurvata fenggangensis]